MTHADCEFVSQDVGTILDVEDVVPGGSYTLEVSSPGVERKISRPQEFERFSGQKIKVGDVNLQYNAVGQTSDSKPKKEAASQVQRERIRIEGAAKLRMVAVEGGKAGLLERARDC